MSPLFVPTFPGSEQEKASILPSAFVLSDERLVNGEPT